MSSNRYSFNTTHIPNPMAESTHRESIYLNGTTRGNMQHFQWGGTPISPKNRNSSSICLNPSSPITSSSNRNATSPQRSNNKLGASKIDPRIYADVQSKGLASRIVKYHESGTRLNRSLSASNLYTKPRQFPTVHLKKTELPYRATKQKLSMTRIAPPEKSIFYGNTLSSLLRSNSVIGLQKTDEEISRENRPILHPPPTENEMAPTRSVLDVLKEISRKRINSDDLELNDTITKKYCSRDSNDNTDSSSTVHITTENERNLNMNQSHKRQREKGNCVPKSHTTNNQCHTTDISSNSISANRASPGSQQNSPEQAAKKRLCSYNNDITSSLSSSLIHANKRNFYEHRKQHSRIVDDTLTSPSTANIAAAVAEDYELHKVKMQCQQPQIDLPPRLKHLQKSLVCNTPITPLPATPLNHIGDNTITTTVPNASLVKRTQSEPIYPTVPMPEKPLSQSFSNKPKITLFNKNYDQPSNTSGAVAVDDIELLQNEHINFVKPKKSTSVAPAGIKNPLITRTQKSKLALMLCSLRGELYQDAVEDEIDAKHQPEVINKISESSETSTTKPSSSGNFDLSTAMTSSTTYANDTKTDSTTSTTPKTITTNAPIIGINSVKAASTPATATTTTPPVKSSTFNESNINVTATVPKLGGFNFTPPSMTTTTTASTTTTTSTTPPKTTSPLVGLKLTPQVVVAVATTTATLSITNTLTAPPTFSFGLKTTVAPAITFTTGSTAVSTLPQLSGFAFTTAITTQTTSATTVSNANTVDNLSSSGNFTFGSALSNTSTAVSSNPNSTTVAPFLGANTTKSTTLASSPLFTFSHSTAPNITTLTTATPLAPFGSIAPATTAAASNPSIPLTGSAFGSLSNTKPLFSFGGPTTATSAIADTTTASSNSTTATARGGFSFGLSAQKSTDPADFQIPNAASFAFGNATNTVAATPSTIASGITNNSSFSFTTPVSKGFSFGAATTVTTTTTTSTSGVGSSFAFTATTTNTPPNSAANLFSGVGTKTTPPIFSFGSASTNTATQSPAFGSASNVAAKKSPIPFAFGASANNVNGSEGTGTGGFAFGGSSANTTQSSSAMGINIFSSATTATNTNATSNAGFGKANFGFGNAAVKDAATPIASNSNSGQSLFGGAIQSTHSANAAVSNNTFSSLAAASNTDLSKSFSFGTSSTTNSNAAPNIFGGNNSNSNNNSKPTSAGGFSFNTAASSTQMNKPVAITAPSTNVFPFGGGNNNNPANANASAPFAFGGSNNNSSAINNKTAAIDNKPFAFGSASNNNSVFGSNTSAPNVPFSFSGKFSADAHTTGAAAVMPPISNNIFAPPLQATGGHGPNDRIIRRATRRLQKP